MTDQGDEMDETTIVVRECVDMEQHARSFNEGYETAVAQGLADDPTLAGDWLDEHDRKVKAATVADVTRLDRVYDALYAAQHGARSVGAEEREACAQLSESFVALLRAEVSS